jgi:lipopolysaccharide transport system permease protein
MKSNPTDAPQVAGARSFGYRGDMTLTSLPRPDAATPDLLKPSAAPHHRVSIDSAPNAGAKAKAAFGDISETLQLWRLVWKLSFLDIRLRYRGSILGPFWLTLSTAVMIGALGFLYAKLFHMDIHSYLPFLSLSLILWNFLSALTAEGCTCFTLSEGMIRASRMPLSMHAARVVIRNFLVFAHNIVVIVVVFAIMRKVPGAQSYLIIPAFVLWFIDGLAICLLLGVFCARFRDVPPIVGSVMQIGFFITPILWSPAILEHRGIGTLLIEWNPFYSLLEIIRAPLIGTPLTFTTWEFAFGYSLVLVVFSAVMFALARPRLAYWV